MVLDGAFGDEQRLTNLAVVVATRHIAQDFAFAVGEVFERRFACVLGWRGCRRRFRWRRSRLGRGFGGTAQVCDEFRGDLRLQR